MSRAAIWSKSITGLQWTLMAALFAGILVTAQMVTSQAHGVREQTRTIGQLRLQQDQARAEWGRLLLEQSFWTAYNRVDRLATTNLAMRIPDPHEIRMLPQ